MDDLLQKRSGKHPALIIRSLVYIRVRFMLERLQTLQRIAEKLSASDLYEEVAARDGSTCFDDMKSQQP